MSELFAHAAYGIIPSEEIQKELQVIVERIFENQLEHENLRWDECVAQANYHEVVKKILHSLKLPSAFVMPLAKEADDVSFIIGWGVLTFPEIASKVDFAKLKKEVPELDWHLWAE